MSEWYNEYEDDDPLDRLSKRQLAELLYRRLAEPLYVHALLLAKGRPEDAEEAVQETFLAVYSLKPRPTLREYRMTLYVVLQNKVIDKYRRLKWEDVTESPDTPVQSDPDNNVAEEVLRQLTDEEVWQALSELPRRQYIVLYLALQLDYGPEQIAKALEISPRTARVHKHRAIQKIRTLHPGLTARTFTDGIVGVDE